MAPINSIQHFICSSRVWQVLIMNADWKCHDTFSKTSHRDKREMEVLKPMRGSQQGQIPLVSVVWCDNASRLSKNVKQRLKYSASVGSVCLNVEFPVSGLPLHKSIVWSLSQIKNNNMSATHHYRARSSHSQHKNNFQRCRKSLERYDYLFQKR